jgi:hypothetical protein
MVKEKQAAEVETKALPKLAQIAVRELQKSFDAAMDEVIGESATVLGVSPKDGWQFDARSLTFVREKPSQTEA